MPESAFIFRHHFSPARIQTLRHTENPGQTGKAEKDRRSHSSTFRVTGFAYCMMFSSVVHIFRDTGRCRASIFAGPAGLQGRKGSRSLTHGWRELEGETAKSEQVNDRKITADGKEGPGDRSGSATLQPARRNPATMEARHSPHDTEAITETHRPCPHGRVKAGPAATSLLLCPGTRQGKGGGFTRQCHHFRIFAGHPPCCGFRPGFQITSRRTSTVKPPARGGSSGIRSTSQASPLDRICSTH